MSTHPIKNIVFYLNMKHASPQLLAFAENSHFGQINRRVWTVLPNAQTAKRQARPLLLCALLKMNIDL